MTTLNCKAILAGAILALAGCADGIDVGRAAPQSVVVASDSVVIAGPPGFCVDRGASRIDGDQAFVLLGSCAAISRNPGQPSPGVPGLLTVTVSEGRTGEAVAGAVLAEMAAFIETPEGRAALSRSGRAETVDILETKVRGDVLYIHARDRSAGQIGVAPDYWRALFGLKNRLLTVSVVGFEDAPISDDTGLSVLDAFAARIRAENGA